MSEAGGQKRLLIIQTSAVQMENLIAQNMLALAPVSALRNGQVEKFALVFLAACLMVAFARPAFATALTSTNWSGYVIISDGMTAISASWTVPEVLCTMEQGQTPGQVSQGIAVWVGFDGWNSNGAFPTQLGTGSYCLNGTPSYGVWYEDPDTVSGTNFSHGMLIQDQISAGDKITVSLTYLGNNKYQLKATDSSIPDSQTLTISIRDAQRASAEWILEAFTNLNTQTQVTLPKFQPFTFSDCSVSVNNITGSISSSNGQPLDMVDNSGNVLVTPQNLNQAGTSFQVIEVT